MALVRHIVGEQPNYMDLIYLLHPSDFLPRNVSHLNGTLTVAEDQNGPRAQSFRMRVVQFLDQGYLQRASAGVDLHVQQYEVLNNSELYLLEHHKDFLVDQAIKEAKHIMEDQCAFNFFAAIASRVEEDPNNSTIFSPLAGRAKLTLALDQSNFNIASQKVGFLGAIIKQEAERACHFEESQGSANTWPPYIASSFITEFLFHSSTLICQHEESLALSDIGALILDPNPPAYQATAENVL